jgi:hypothetical protein
MNPSPGQIWKDNDPRYDRYIRVKGVGSDFVRIVRVNEDGTEFTRAYSTSSSLERFRDTGRNGFTFWRTR